MNFPVAEVDSHVRENADLLAGVLGQLIGESVDIDTEAISLASETPEFHTYGLAVWVVCGSTTLSILLPDKILPAEWDGSAFAPQDVGERLISAMLPETISYLPSRIRPVSEVAGAFCETTQTLSIPISVCDRPVVMLIGLYNPTAVDRVGRGRLSGVPVRVSVRLAEKQIDVRQFLGLGPGQLIPFDKPAEDFLDMYVNNHLHARGEAVKIGENFGIRISQVGVRRERTSPVLGPAQNGDG